MSARRMYEKATLVLFRLLPSMRRGWLVATLRAYQALYQYAIFVATAYLGRSPKYFYEWGIHSFFVPRIPPGARALDVGCGHGFLAEKIATRARVVVAFDRDLVVVRAASRRAPPNVHYFCGDAIDALPNGAFDVAILSGVLPFVRNPKELLIALRRIAPELLIRETRYDRDATVPLMASLGVSHKTDPSVLREYTKELLIAELERCGWRVAETVDSYDMFVRAVRD
jgi:SAM-dependent methyltransferase